MPLVEQPIQIKTSGDPNPLDLLTDTDGKYVICGECGKSYTIDLVSEGGKCLWMGNIDKDLTLSKKRVSSILRKEIQIIGCWNSDFKTTNKLDDWKESIIFIKKYKIQMSKFITKFIKLEDMQKFFNKMYLHKLGKRKHNYIKYIAKI